MVKRLCSRFLVPFATILVVGGVVAIAYLYPNQNPAPGPILPADQTASLTEVKPLSIVLVNEGRARLFFNGEDKVLSWPEDIKLLGQPLSTLEGRDLGSGERAYLQEGFTLTGANFGIRSPDGRRTLHPAPARADGAGAFEVRFGLDQQIIAVRLPGGQGVQDVRPLGWWDSQTVAVMGLASSSRAIFSVGLSGGTRQVALLPDTAEQLAAYYGKVWYVTAERGQGLEQPPAPPSELHQLSFDGTDNLLSRETNRVILHYAPSLDAQVAYLTDDGQTVSSNRGGVAYDLNVPNYPVGEGVPLGFADKTKLIFKTDQKLWLKDLITGQEDLIIDLASDKGAIFILQTPNVDEINKSL
jgi:hypothetical protein